MTDYVGQQFGDYQLIRYIKGGGFADVYEARQVHLGTQAAVKLLKGRLTEQEKEAFRREARIVVELEHPHIVRVYTFSVERDTPYIAMSYASQGSLDIHHPRGSVLPLPTIVSYVNQIADALQYAHTQKVIHRDVKPANFLVGKDGQILLADFGIAIIAQQTASWKEQQVAGTYLYMAPEQFQAQAQRESDQYSLGIVAYQWLCGELPFTGNGNVHALLYQHMHTPPPPLSEKVSLPPMVEAVVLKALAKSPQERFSSVQAFAKALEQAIQIDSPPVGQKTKVQWRNEGFAHYNAKQYEKAIAAYDLAIQLDPAYVLAYYNRGLAYHAIGEYRKAISDYDRVLRLDPNFALAERKRKDAYNMRDRK